jgi:hypothetical protein
MCASQIFENAIDARESRMIEALENIPFREKARTFRRGGIEHLFKGVDIAPGPPIPDTIDRARASLAKQILDKIALSYDSSSREKQRHVPHRTPQYLS